MGDYLSVAANPESRLDFTDRPFQVVNAIGQCRLGWACTEPMVHTILGWYHLWEISSWVGNPVKLCHVTPRVSEG